MKESLLSESGEALVTGNLTKRALLMRALAGEHVGSIIDSNKRATTQVQSSI